MARQERQCRPQPPLSCDTASGANPGHCAQLRRCLGRPVPARPPPLGRKTRHDNGVSYCGNTRPFSARAMDAAKFTPYFHAVSLVPRGRAYKRGGRAYRGRRRVRISVGTIALALASLLAADASAQTGPPSLRNRWSPRLWAALPSSRSRRAAKSCSRRCWRGPTISTRPSSMPRCRCRWATWRRRSARSSAC